MTHDISEVFRTEPDIKRMHNRSHTWDRKISFEMLIVIPAERGDPVPRPDAEPVKSNGQLLHPNSEVSVRVAMNTSVGNPGDDLLFPKQIFRPSQDSWKGQLILHH